MNTGRDTHIDYSEKDLCHLKMMNQAAAGKVEDHIEAIATIEWRRVCVLFPSQRLIAVFKLREEGKQIRKQLSDLAASSPFSLDPLLLPLQHSGPLPYDIGAQLSYLSFECEQRRRIRVAGSHIRQANTSWRSKVFELLRKVEGEFVGVELASEVQGLRGEYNDLEEHPVALFLHALEDFHARCVILLRFSSPDCKHYRHSMEAEISMNHCTHSFSTHLIDVLRISGDIKSLYDRLETACLEEGNISSVAHHIMDIAQHLRTIQHLLSEDEHRIIQFPRQMDGFLFAELNASATTSKDNLTKLMSERGVRQVVAAMESLLSFFCNGPHR